MITFINILAIAILSNILTWDSLEISGFIQNKMRLNFKPFTCNKCLAFWCAFIWTLFFHSELSVLSIFIESLVNGFICYFFSHIVFLVLMKSKW